MNIIIFTLVILTIFYLLLKKFSTISSRKISKSVRILLVIGLFLLAILFAIGGKFLLTLPLTLASFALLKLKGLSILQLISLFRLIQTLRKSGRFSFNKSNIKQQSSDFRSGSLCVGPSAFSLHHLWVSPSIFYK